MSLFQPITKPDAVILIDMQTKFVSGLRSGECRRILPAQLKILQYCSFFNVPIVVLELKTYEFGETLPELKQFISQVSQHKYLEKFYDDGFSETDLEQYLHSVKAKKLFVMGINACYCVKETVESALKKGFEIIISDDVISGQDHHSNDNDLPWYQQHCHVVSIKQKPPL